MLVIGIAGRMGAGKDTVAGVLAREYGFTQYNFATPLKEEVCARLSRTVWAAVNVLSETDTELASRLQTMYAGGMTSPQVLHEIVWNIKPPIVRELLQEYGTEVRRTDHPDYWVDAWGKAVGDYQNYAGQKGTLARVVASDVRFENECHAIQHFGGQLVHVVREGARDASQDAHQSERLAEHWSHWDQVIISPLKGVQALQDAVRLWADAWLGTKPWKEGASRGS
jgi:predicted kinase